MQKNFSRASLEKGVLQPIKQFYRMMSVEKYFCNKV